MSSDFSCGTLEFWRIITFEASSVIRYMPNLADSSWCLEPAMIMKALPFMKAAPYIAGSCDGIGAVA